jgi:NCAIR mutase (PurE)-related protein
MGPLTTGNHTSPPKCVKVARDAGRDKEGCQSHVGEAALPVRESPASASLHGDRSMGPAELRVLLEEVRAGRVGVDDALGQLPSPALADLGFAHVDLDRGRRCGFPEVVFAEGKTPDWVEGVARKLIAAGQDCLVTRVNEEQRTRLAQAFPEADQDVVARTFWRPSTQGKRAVTGRVLVLTAGTSDLPVAREAVVTATALGCATELIADVGVAGLHRLLRYRDRLHEADAVVVVAGMDGALPSVVGGLSDAPVIAVPTSIGYGAAFGGVAALLTMLNACSANVVVVNIDSGFKGGYVAALIARRAATRMTPSSG